MAEGRRPLRERLESPLWGWGLALVAVALAVRLLAWALVPWGEFGQSGDEVSYYRCGMRLVLLHEQDLFWAPMAGWVIGAVSTLMGTEKVHWLRLAWVVLDVLNVLLIFRLAGRLETLRKGAGRPSPGFGLPHLAALGYALYLPAVGYAVHMTGEALSLFFLLASLWAADWKAPLRLGRMAAAGALAGAMVLTRPNLAPVAVAFGFALVLLNWDALPRWKSSLLPAALLVGFAALPSAAWIARNYAQTGYLFLNLSYPQGFYRAAMATYQEDLRLVDSRPNDYEVDSKRVHLERLSRLNERLVEIREAPTREATRKTIVEGLLQVRPPTPQEVFEKRSAAILRVTQDRKTASLGEQLYRGLSRFLRSLAPKTGAFDLVSRARPLKDPLKFALFAVANLQWALVLAFGLAGLLSGASLDVRARLLLLAVVVGGLATTPIAHGEPRYAFPIEFALLTAAAAWWWAPRVSLQALLGRRARWIPFAILTGVLAWTWLAAARWAFAGSLRGTW